MPALFETIDTEDHSGARQVQNQGFQTAGASNPSQPVILRRVNLDFLTLNSEL